MLISIIVVVVAGGALFFRARRHEKPTIQGPALSVRFLDADSGNAVLLRTPEGKVAVIDPSPRRIDDLIDQLTDQDVRELTVILCDTSYDSARAAAKLQRAVKVERLIALQEQPEPEQWESTLAQAKCRAAATTLVSPGSIAELSSTVRLSFLNCSAGNANIDGSCVLRLSYKAKTLLYVSELDTEGEAGLISPGNDLECSILAVGREARRDNPSLELLSKTRPQICVLCSRSPWSSVIRRLRPENSGAALFQTAKDGIIEIVTDGHSVQSTAGGGQ